MKAVPAQFRPRLRHSLYAAWVLTICGLVSIGLTLPGDATLADQSQGTILNSNWIEPDRATTSDLSRLSSPAKGPLSLEERGQMRRRSLQERAQLGASTSTDTSGFPTQPLLPPMTSRSTQEETPEPAAGGTTSPSATPDSASSPTAPASPDSPPSTDSAGPRSTTAKNGNKSAKGSPTSVSSPSATSTAPSSASHPSTDSNSSTPAPSSKSSPSKPPAGSTGPQGIPTSSRPSPTPRVEPTGDPGNQSPTSAPTQSPSRSARPTSSAPKPSDSPSTSAPAEDHQHLIDLCLGDLLCLGLL